MFSTSSLTNPDHITRVAAQASNGFQELPAVTDRAHADFLQVLLRKDREDLLVYLVVSECRLVSFEAQAPQPNRDVHGGAPCQVHMNIEVKLCPEPARLNVSDGSNASLSPRAGYFRFSPNSGHVAAPQ
jgi:hypothetical protein